MMFTKGSGLPLHVSRREMLAKSGLGFGSLALSWLLSQERGFAEAPRVAAVPMDLKPRAGHFPGRAKAVIQLMQNGGPSQMDLFDNKPELTKRSGQPHPLKVETFSPKKNKNILLGTP